MWPRLALTLNKWFFCSLVLDYRCIPPYQTLFFFFLNLSVYGCACLCAHRVQTRSLRVLVYHLPPVPLRQGLSMNLKLRFSQLVWNPANPSNPPVSSLLGAGVNKMLACNRYRDLNSVFLLSHLSKPSPHSFFKDLLSVLQIQGLVSYPQTGSWEWTPWSRHEHRQLSPDSRVQPGLPSTTVQQQVWVGWHCYILLHLLDSNRTLM